MAEKYQLQNMSEFHEALLDFLLMDPRPGNKTRAALHFNVTRSWISQVIHGDMFQARMRDRQDALGAVVFDLRTKTAAVADEALERLGERIQLETDPKVLSDVADKALKALGFGTPAASPGPVVNQQNNYYGVEPSNLARYRERLMKEGEAARAQQELPAPKSIQGSLTSDLGGSEREPAVLHPEPAPVAGSGEAGVEIPGTSERVVES